MTGQSEPVGLDRVQPIRLPGGMIGGRKKFGFGDALAHFAMGAASGMGNSAPLQAYQQAEELKARQMAEEQQYQRESLAAEQERYAPRSVGGSLIQMRPDGSYQTLYDAPQPFELYAKSLGHQPGTEGYRRAIQDYRLNEWSAPALEAKRDLEGYRFGRQRELQDDRLDVQRRGQDLSAATTRRGQDMVDSRARTKDQGRQPEVRVGDIVRNPTTGERREYLGNGRWKKL